MVQISCRGASRNADQLFTVLYSLEFAASGMVHPMMASVTTELASQDRALAASAAVNCLLLFSAYYWNEQVAELAIQGPFQYGAESRWTHFIDLCGVVAAFGAFVALALMVAAEPEGGGSATAVPRRYGLWAQGHAAEVFQIWLGSSLFLLCFCTL